MARPVPRYHQERKVDLQPHLPIPPTIEHTQTNVKRTNRPQQLSAIASQPADDYYSGKPPARVIKTGQQTAIVRPANEALQILETHRNQSKDETNDLKQNQNKTTTNTNPQAIVIKN